MITSQISTTSQPAVGEIVDSIAARKRFVISSHSRPDGDSIGSQLAMAFALRALGKEVRVVNSDAAPGPLMAFPGVAEIEIAARVDGAFDAAIIMECGDLTRTGVGGLGVPLSVEMATHIYVAILTDTGSFHYSSISPRTFEICREALVAGVEPVLVARHVYDSNNIGRLRLFGTVLSAMQLDTTGRIAMVYLDHEMARPAGGASAN